jgi:hypothetical protein
MAGGWCAMGERVLRGRRRRTHPTEARCPECRGWFPVHWFGDLPPGGFWWAHGDGGCPGCGHPIAVETECEFR